MARKKLVKKAVIPNQEAIIYAHRQGYKIYPTTNDNETYKIVMELGHQKAILEEVYTKRDVDWGLQEIYNRVYERQNN
jgi:hypothetical protein